MKSLHTIQLLSILLLLTCCKPKEKKEQQKEVTSVASRDYFPDKVKVKYAKNFTVTYHSNYKVVRTSATLGNWDTQGGEMEDVEDVMVLAQRGTAVPKLTDELAGATVVTIPADRRIATNSAQLEIWLDMLGLHEKKSRPFLFK